YNCTMLLVGSHSLATIAALSSSSSSTTIYSKKLKVILIPHAHCITNVHVAANLTLWSQNQHSSAAASSSSSSTAALPPSSSSSSPSSSSAAALMSSGSINATAAAAAGVASVHSAIAPQSVLQLIVDVEFEGAAIPPNYHTSLTHIVVDDKRKVLILADIT